MEKKRGTESATRRTGSAVRCFKCRNDVAVMATREGPKKSYCVSCLVDFCHRTVRDTLFRHCLLPPRIPIVLCVSGGVNSMAMLHLVGVLRQQNLRRGGNGRIEFCVSVLHLTEEGIVTNSADADQGSGSGDHAAQSSSSSAITSNAKTVADTVLRFATQTMYDGVPLFSRSEVHVLSMRDVLSSAAAASTARSNGTAAVSSLERLATPLMASMAGAASSDVEEVYLRLKMRAIAAAAQRIVALEATSGCVAIAPIVLLGENGVRCCVRGLGDLVRGNGPHIPVGSAYRSWIAPNALAMRPLRGLLPKEIVMYCKLEGVPYHSPLTPASMSSFPVKSVNSTLEAFVSTLMRSFPSTPFNILNSISLMSCTVNHDDDIAPRTTFGGGPQTSAGGHPHPSPRLEVDAGDDVASVSGASAAPSSSSVSSSAGRVILSKASEANHRAVLRLMELARLDTRGGEPTSRACAACDAAIPPDEMSSAPTDRPLCYACQALQAALLSDPNCTAIWDELLTSPWRTEGRGGVEGLETTALTSMSAEEVAQEVAEYLVN